MPQAPLTQQNVIPSSGEGSAFPLFGPSGAPSSPPVAAHSFPTEQVDFFFAFASPHIERELSSTHFSPGASGSVFEPGSLGEHSEGCCEYALIPSTHPFICKITPSSHFWADPSLKTPLEFLAVCYEIQNRSLLELAPCVGAEKPGAYNPVLPEATSVFAWASSGRSERMPSQFFSSWL